MPKTDFIPIQTERLIVDEFKPSDYARLQEIAFKINYQADNHAAEGYCPFYTFQVDKNTPDRDVVIRQKVAQFLIKADRERQQSPRSTYRMAVRRPDGYLLGNATVDMLPIEENGKKIYGDLGYFIDPDYGDKGYATEAVRGLVHQFFKKYQKLDITAHPANKFSRRLIERIGGVQVGYNAASHYGHGEPRAVFEVHRRDFYRTCAFNQKMPNLLAVLVNRQQKRDK
jgi:RimJ/RimL family protein N-acetyltransferase